MESETASMPLPRFEIIARDSAHVPIGKPEPFEFAIADIDLDDDPDLIVNWHLFDVDLFRNESVNFVRLDRDISGLYHEGGVNLYADLEQVVSSARSTPGIYLWHDSTPIGNWNIYISQDTGSVSPVEFTLRSNEIIESFSGVSEDRIIRKPAMQTRDDAWASFSLLPSDLPIHITFRSKLVGADMQITKDSELPFIIGSTFKEVTGRQVNLRKPDPHAMAWVNILGSPNPDLFIARGGNRGRLAPPFPAKTNSLFVAEKTVGTLFRLKSDSSIPSDYGRGRSLSWVDVDGDGRNELYLGNRESSNSLLVFDDKSQTFHDESSKFGLGFHCGDAFTWLDLDQDSYEDLVFLTCSGSVAYAHNRFGKDFFISNAEDSGIILGKHGRQEALFETTTIQTFDFDADGDLDILVSGLGRQHRLKVFQKDKERFLDVTKRIGLETASATISIPTDIDNDGFLDLVSGGTDGLRVYMNQAGVGFKLTKPLVQNNERLASAKVSALAVADFDGDGGKDLVLGGMASWWLLANRTARAGNSVQVVLKNQDRSEPIGTLVRAHYDDGKILAQRYGSADTNGLSQSVAPLTFGSTDKRTIEYFTYIAPGHERWQRTDVIEPNAGINTPPTTHIAAKTIITVR